MASLAGHPVARRLTVEQAERLASCGREVRFAAGALIFREGDDAGALYLLRGGRVALEQQIPGRGVVQVENLIGGDILGLSWLFPDAHWTLDARAVEPVEAFVLDAGCVRARMGEDPVLGYALTGWLVEQLYHRLMRVRLQRLDVYGGGGVEGAGGGEGGRGAGEAGSGRKERAGEETWGAGARGAGESCVERGGEWGGRIRRGGGGGLGG